MVKGQHHTDSVTATKSRSRRISSKGRATTSTPNISTIQSNPHSAPSCSGCGKIITKDTRALQCDGCIQNDAWKCAECLDLSDEMYDQLMQGIDLKWLCNTCEGRLSTKEDQNVDTDKLDHITKMLEVLISRTKSIEENIKEKADKADVDALEARVATLETNSNAVQKGLIEVKQTLEKEITENKWSTICDKEADTVSKINELEQKLSNLEDESKNNKQSLKDYVQTAVEEQAQETNAEQLEKEKRKTSIIIHGLAESGAQDSSERAEDDNCAMASMLQVMGCAEAKVTKAIRLGKYQTPNQAGTSSKPRPVKVAFETEADKNEVLKSSKNLKTMEEGAWSSVFLHQDLTMKERETRRALIQELKRRKTNGETDLILVGLKIVKRRYTQPNEEVEAADGQ